jgi:hypothetical protein
MCQQLFIFEVAPLTDGEVLVCQGHFKGPQPLQKAASETGKDSYSLASA